MWRSYLEYPGQEILHLYWEVPFYSRILCNEFALITSAICMLLNAVSGRRIGCSGRSYQFHYETIALTQSLTHDDASLSNLFIQAMSRSLQASAVLAKRRGTYRTRSDKTGRETEQANKNRKQRGRNRNRQTGRATTRTETGEPTNAGQT